MASLIKVGIITSSAGSTIAAVFKILKSSEVDFDFVVVTDRECDSELIAEKHGHSFKRIPYEEDFDQKAYDYLFVEQKVDIVILLHSRLISEVLFKTNKCFNIHPSLLPAFPGMGATTRAFEAKVRYIGVTSHLVDGGMDTGLILSQSLVPIMAEESLAQINRKSHYLRIYTFLQILETQFPNEMHVPADDNIKITPLGNPPLKNLSIKSHFRNYARDISTLHEFL